MDRKVIHLFGASGSGTSTLGRYIAQQSGCYFMDTDDYFWAPTDPPYTTTRPVTERLELIRRDIGLHERAVLSGSIVDWGDELIPLFTLAVRVGTPTPVRIERLRKRERDKFGGRIDPGGDMYDNHNNFIKWAASYDDGGTDMRSKAKHDEWQKLLQCPLVIVDGSQPVETNWEIIIRHL